MSQSHYNLMVLEGGKPLHMVIGLLTIAKIRPHLAPYKGRCPWTSAALKAYSLRSQADPPK